MPFASYALHKSTCYAGTVITLKLLRLHKEIESQHLIKFAVQCARGAVNRVSRRILKQYIPRGHANCEAVRVKSNRYAVNTLICLKGRTRESVPFIFNLFYCMQQPLSIDIDYHRVILSLFKIQWYYN